MYWCGRDDRTDSRRDAGATLNGVPTEAIGFAREFLESALTRFAQHDDSFIQRLNGFLCSGSSGFRVDCVLCVRSFGKAYFFPCNWMEAKASAGQRVHASGRGVWAMCGASGVRIFTKSGPWAICGMVSSRKPAASAMHK